MPTPINISASRGAAILGLSEWMTPVEAWLQIMESRQPGFCEQNKFELPVVEYNSRMKWGHAFESAVIELAENVTGIKIVNREQLYAFRPNDNDEYVTCHIDGCYDNFETLHEGKTTDIFSYRDKWGEPGTDKIPMEYQVQCQHQMICTGAEKVILSVLVFPKSVEEWDQAGYIPMLNENGIWQINNDQFINAICPTEWAKTLSQMGFFHQYHIQANAELQQMMLDMYADFWHNHVLAEIPPDAKKYDDIRRLVREPVGTIIADETIERLIAEKKSISDEISGTGTLAKRVDQIKMQILQYANEKEKIVDDESTDKWIIRDRQGKKIAQYSRNKNGVMVLR